MKLLVQGRKQLGWAKEFICTGQGNGGGGCGATLLVEQDDLFQTTNTCMGETDYFVTFECNQCQVWTDVVVPGQVSQGLPHRVPRAPRARNRNDE